MKKTLLFSSFLLFSFASAQYEENLRYGIKAGGVYSKIGNLPKVIVSEIYYQGYSLKEKEKYGGTFGLFLNYKFPYSRLALQPEISYSMQGGKLEYSDIKELQYSMDFQYNYLNITTLLKVYPAGGVNLGIGPSLSFNLTPEKIKYKSNKPEFGSDLTTQQLLQDVLKGKTDFSIAFNLGYEWENGVTIDARYNLGLNDVLETQANGYKFIENTNRSSVFMLTIGYGFTFDSRHTF